MVGYGPMKTFEIQNLSSNQTLTGVSPIGNSECKGLIFINTLAFRIPKKFIDFFEVTSMAPWAMLLVF